MMSMTTLKSSSQASTYYSKDNYYTKEPTAESLEKAEWYGKGAEVLGLVDQDFDPDKFKELLEGTIDEDNKIGRVTYEDGVAVTQHRPGVDLTFSAPKSVSIISEVFKDDDVRNAHEDAVKATLDFVEKKYSDALLYFFINKTAYSGMIRYNSKGEFNVPYGRYANLNTSLATKAHSKLLSKTEIYNLDYKDIFEMAEEDDFMFLDPPYDCVFSDYGNAEHKDGFNERNHIELANQYKNLKCKALMVIGRTPLTEKLYGDYIVDEYGKSYAVNIRNRFKSEASHILISNYGNEALKREPKLILEEESISYG